MIVTVICAQCRSRAGLTWLCQTTLADLGSPAARPNTQLPDRGWHVSVRGHTEDWTVSAAIRLLTRATHITQGSGRAFKGRVVLQPPQCWLLVVVSPARTLRGRLCSSEDEQQSGAMFLMLQVRLL